MTMLRIHTPLIPALLAVILMAGCGSANGSDDTDSRAGATLPDMSLGAEDAPVTLIEYASVTCGHCAQFHQEVLPVIKEDYVSTGKVRFVFREFPTPPQNIAIAGFALARCAGEDRYFDVLDDLFDSQPGIMMAAREGAAGPALKAIAERHGIEGDEAFESCINDRSIREDIADVAISGEEFGVNSTPTLILQGDVMASTVQSRTAEGLSGLIDEELAALGVEVESATADGAGPVAEPADTEQSGASDN
ncbi:MAG: thioredoxin domain-containing protein [Alphaproteobacteria bacterium]|nr:thioredoxin domain-containing protein [Alphaproteobacteria bacterium]